MSLSIQYIDVPVGAQEAATATANASQPFGSAAQTVTGVADTPWVTLEPKGWVLDGKKRLLPDSAAQIGWWSKKRTGSNGRFSTPPVITVTFPEPYTATGLTFWFWPSLGHWCSEMTVRWYLGQTLLTEATVYPTDTKWILEQSVESFDKITVELAATNIPGQFAKLQQIQIGQIVVFLQEDIVRVSILNEMDPALCELSADTMRIELRDRKGRSIIPQKNQSMLLYRDGQQLASQYIVDSSREEQKYYIFQCQSAVGLLDDDFMGGIYKKYPLGTLLAAVMGDVSYTLDDSFSGQTVTGYLPVCTRREALQQIAFAIGAVVTTQEDGTVCLLPCNKEVAHTFTGSDVFTGAKVTREAQTAVVQIYAHSYKPGKEEETLLDQESVDGSGVVFVFSAPHHSYTITGGTIEASGENWVQISAAGEVTLTGKKYVHSTSVRTKRNPLATAAEKSNVVSVDNATLIHSGNVAAALERLYEAQKLKNVLQEDAVISEQKTGQLVSSINPWGTTTVGYITRMESEFTNSGHTARLTIRGVENNAYEGKNLFAEGEVTV